MMKIANTNQMKLNDPKMDEIHDKLIYSHYTKRGKKLTQIENENVAFLKRLENVKSDYKNVSPRIKNKLASMRESITGLVKQEDSPIVT